MYKKQLRRKHMLIVILVLAGICILLILVLLFTSASDKESPLEKKEDATLDTIVQDDTIEENINKEPVSKNDTPLSKGDVPENEHENIEQNISFEDEVGLEEKPSADNGRPTTNPSKPPVTESSEPPSETEDSNLPPKAPVQDGEWGTPIQN